MQTNFSGEKCKPIKWQILCCDICFIGDCPVGNIVTMALRTTNKLGKEVYSKAANIVLHNVYVDDIGDSLT